MMEFQDGVAAGAVRLFAMYRKCNLYVYQEPSGFVTSACIIRYDITHRMDITGQLENNK